MCDGLCDFGATYELESTVNMVEATAAMEEEGESSGSLNEIVRAMLFVAAPVKTLNGVPYGSKHRLLKLGLPLQVYFPPRGK